METDLEFRLANSAGADRSGAFVSRVSRESGDTPDEQDHFWVIQKLDACFKIYDRTPAAPGDWVVSFKVGHPMLLVVIGVWELLDADKGNPCIRMEYVIRDWKLTPQIHMKDKNFIQAVHAGLGPYTSSNPADLLVVNEDIVAQVVPPHIFRGSPQSR